MNLEAVIQSCVGGGPMQRLAARLAAAGVAARVLAPDSPESWRQRMAGTRADRLHARLRSFVLTPLQSLADAIASPGHVVVPTTNPFFLPAFLVLTRWLHGRAVVPLVYDLWPDALEAGDAAPPAWVSRLASTLNRATFAEADFVVFIGAKMAEHAIARYGAPRRWTVIETGADASELAPEAHAGPPESDLEAWMAPRLIISYVGNLGHVHDVDTLAEAVPRFLAGLSSAEQARTGIVIAASGPGLAILRERWKQLGDAVRFEPPLSDRAWARLLVRSAVSIATLRKAAHRTSIPSKALSAMGAGSALLAIAPADSDLGALVELHKAGWLVEPGDVDGAVHALTEARRNAEGLERRRQAARHAAVHHYDIAVLAERWRSVLAEAAERRAPDRTYDAIKRALDVAAAGAGLALVMPVLSVAAVAAAASVGRPVLFRQERPGRTGTSFHLRKFRTMRAPGPGEVGPEYDAVRLTRVGRLLRRTSIDELPTLWNVLRGDMSLVGPRPLLMRYLPRYSARQGRRHEVSPGVTGWAQINGRNALTWDQKFDYDVWYVQNRSILLDLRILLRTVQKVLVPEGISQSGHATMPEFMGETIPRGEGREEGVP